MKADTEWNYVNYFAELDKTIASNCSKDDKVTLLLLKGIYYKSVERFNEALEVTHLAEKYLPFIKDKDSIQAIIQLRKAGFYTKMNLYFEAYQEWTKCNNYYLLTRNNNGLANSQLLLATIFLTLNQNKQAYKALKRSEKHAVISGNNKTRSIVYYGFSAYWANMNELDSAIHYISLSESFSDPETINLISDYNKGVIYYKKGDLDNSSLFFHKTVNDSKKVKCIGYEGVGKYGLALTYLEKEPKKAFQLMKEALELIDQSNPDLGIFICECILENFEGEEYKQLLPFFEKRRTSFRQKKEHLDNNQISKLFNMTSLMSEQLLFAQHEIEQKKISQVEQEKQIVLMTIVGLAILFILLITLYLNSKIVKSRRLLKDQNEKQGRVLNHSIVTITNYNAMAEDLSHKLKQLALQQTSKKLTDQLYELSKNIGDLAVGTKSKELKDLDLVIQSINDGFVKTLCSKFSNLTSNEVTLAIYLRMNFSTKQIAELKGTSENSIDVARSRLRAKLGIKGESIDLTNFLNRI